MSAGTWRPTRILKVTDTRALVEEGERFVRVPGTGATRQCERCGRDHEVHVTVLGDDNLEYVVGIACAHATGPLAAQLQSVVSATRTVDRLRAELAQATERYATYRAAVAAVDALAPPEVVSEPYDGFGGWIWHATNEPRYHAYGRPPTSYANSREAEAGGAERRLCVLDQWRRAELQARGFAREPESPDRARLIRAERRLAALLAQ